MPGFVPESWTIVNERIRLSEALEGRLADEEVEVTEHQIAFAFSKPRAERR